MKSVREHFFTIVNSKREKLSNEFHVTRIGIFGSCVRGEESKDSDVDVLVEFEIKTFDNFMDLKFFLEDQLGRRVDLVIMDSLKPAIRDKVLGEVKYAA